MFVSKVCRLCLTTDNLSWIFDVVNESTNIRDVVYFATGIEIHKKDVISQQICDNCFKLTNEMFLFRNQCIESEKYLKEQYKKYAKKKKFKIPNTQVTIGNIENQISSKPKTLSHNIHPSVIQLSNAYPEMKLPALCLKSHLAPVVEMEMDEVESYFEKRNLDINVHIQSALKYARNANRLAKLKKLNAETETNDLETHQRKDKPINCRVNIKRSLKGGSIKQCLKNNSKKTEPNIRTKASVKVHQINNSSVVKSKKHAKIVKTERVVEIKGVKRSLKKQFENANKNKTSRAKFVTKGQPRGQQTVPVNRKRKVSKMTTKSDTKRLKVKDPLDTSMASTSTVQVEDATVTNNKSDTKRLTLKDPLDTSMASTSTVHSFNRIDLPQVEDTTVTNNKSDTKRLTLEDPLDTSMASTSTVHSFNRIDLPQVEDTTVTNNKSYTKRLTLKDPLDTSMASTSTVQVEDNTVTNNKSDTKRLTLKDSLDTSMASTSTLHSFNIIDLSQVDTTVTKGPIDLTAQPKGTTHSLVENNYSEFFSCIDKSVPLHICNMCNSVQYSAKRLRKHRSDHLRCQFCKVRFRTLPNKIRHVKDTCIIKKAITNMPDIEVEKVEFDSEIRRKYPNAFVNFSPLENQYNAHRITCDNVLELLKLDARYMTDPLNFSLAKEASTNMIEDQGVVISSCEDESDNTIGKNHRKESDLTKSTDPSSTCPSHEVEDSLISPSINVKTSRVKSNKRQDQGVVEILSLEHEIFNTIIGNHTDEESGLTKSTNPSSTCPSDEVKDSLISPSISDKTNSVKSNKRQDQGVVEILSLEHEIFNTIVENLTEESDSTKYSTNPLSTDEMQNSLISLNINNKNNSVKNKRPKDRGVIEISSDEDESYNTMSEDFTEECSSAKSSLNPSVSCSADGVQDSLIISPNINIRNINLSTVCPAKNDVEIMKKLLFLTQTIMCSNQKHTQTQLPTSNDITMFDKAIMLKNLKGHLRTYKIPVKIRNGNLNVSYDYNVSPKQNNKLCFWNDLTPIDIEETIIDSNNAP